MRRIRAVWESHDSENAFFRFDTLLFLQFEKLLHEGIGFFDKIRACHPVILA
jgi:hypothetical protein